MKTKKRVSVKTLPSRRGHAWLEPTTKEILPLSYWNKIPASYEQNRRVLYAIKDIRRTIEDPVSGVIIDEIRAELRHQRELIEELKEEVTRIKGFIDSEVQFAIVDFIDLVKELPIVKQVFLTKNEDISELLILIEAEPFDDVATTPIYDAQIKTMQLLRKPMLSFHLINLKEIDVPVANLIPPNASLILER